MDKALAAIELTKIFERKVSKAGGIGRAFGLMKTREEVRAVDTVSFEVEKSRLFGLLGPNGAGKTTTIKLLCTLLVPDGGTAIVNGYDVSRHPDKVRESVGVVTGGERGLYWRLTARENLLFYARLYNMPDDLARRRIRELLELVELDGRADELVERYSRGMKQRLHLVRGLIHDPPVLLLDEPTLGLDPASARVIREFIKEKLQKEQGKTILLTTHYMEEADQLCDKLAIIDYGKIIASGTPEDLKKLIKQTEIVRISAQNATLGSEAGLREIPGVSNVSVQFTQPATGLAEITLHADKMEEVLSAVMNVLVKEGVRIKVVEETRPTLEDVFISLTGRKLRD